MHLYVNVKQHQFIARPGGSTEEHLTTDQRVAGSNPASDDFSATSLKVINPSVISVTFSGSIVVSIPACHAGDPGSIPGRRVFTAAPFSARPGFESWAHLV
jgi:hypothetical protein